ncbi:MAG: hypothetical protein K6E36_08425 [Oscillospiraceae bacterium]|nr:hypothetical protein [Oscillospiraceae bacterium]MCR5306507.1 hypothetical protein [Oscillospiraceae bacterium]
MKRILTPAALLLCMTLLSACGEPVSSAAPVTAGSVASDTAVTTELTTEAASASSSASESTASASESAASDTTVTERTAASADSTAAASGSTAASSASSSATTASSEKKTESGKALFDEVCPGKDCTAYVSAHKDYSFQKAASCIGSGEDRVYTYQNFKIISYYENGKDTVQEIELTGTGVSTREGVKVGMTTSDIEKAYGAPAIPGEYIYSIADGTVDFLLNSDKKTIKSISLYTEEEPA